VGVHDENVLFDYDCRTVRHRLCVWDGIRLHEKGGAENTSRPGPSAIERTNKSDQILHALNVRGAVMPALFSVEILDFPRTAVTIRDHDGSILYRISPTERMTVVAKRVPQTPVVTPRRVSAPQESGSPGTARELPDGCESAFSPFVDPGMANVIGRCVS